MVIEEILNNYKGNIVRACKMFSTDTEERKDLFQEISFQLYKALPGFKGDSSITTFIYRISINTCIRFKYKFLGKEPKISLEDIEWYIEDDSKISLDRKERYEQLYYCISRLKEADKTMVLLYLEELSYKEISEITGLTENNIAVKMSRIKEKLFNCLTINNF